MRVVFFGTPDFAVPSLRALVGEGFDVLAAITPPDRARGRSRSALAASPVKEAALAEGIPVLQPDHPSDAAFGNDLRALAPDIGVVVAYGHILKPELLAIPARGMVNVHPSLLPELRGAAPIEWSIIRGLERTGVTIMQMDAGMDSGPIIHQIPHRLDDELSAGELSAHLAEMGAQALVEALAMLEQDALRPVPQDHSKATFAPKVTRELARLDWTKAAEVIARFTRGLDPKPGAWTELPGAGGSADSTPIEVKLFCGHVVEGRGEPGEVLVADDTLVISAVRGAVAVDEVQPAGRSRMRAADWVRGRGVQVGQRFT